MLFIFVGNVSIHDYNVVAAVSYFRRLAFVYRESICILCLPFFSELTVKPTVIILSWYSFYYKFIYVGYNKGCL